MAKKSSSTGKSPLVALSIVVLAIPIVFVLFIVLDSSKNEASSEKVLSGSDVNIDDGFLGERGMSLQAEGDSVYIDEALVSDGDMESFNYYSEKDDKNVYFFIVKASDGTYRAAASACEVCYGTKKGFEQVGDKIICNNCGTTYSKDQIALQKGGCNPRPIGSDVTVENGKLALNVSDIEASAELF